MHKWLRICIALVALSCFGGVEFRVNDDGVFLYGTYRPFESGTTLTDVSGAGFAVSNGAVFFDESYFYIDDYKFTPLSDPYAIRAEPNYGTYIKYPETVTNMISVYSISISGGTNWEYKVQDLAKFTFVSGSTNVLVYDDNTNGFVVVTNDFSGVTSAEVRAKVGTPVGDKLHQIDVALYGRGTYPDITTPLPTVDLSSFDAFAPPVASFTMTGTPQIAEFTRQGDSGDTIAITGEEF